MARPSDPLGSPDLPPRLAERIITVLAPAQDRSVMLGDLSEEYANRRAASHADADRWYWRQVVRSSPHLLLSRARSSSAQQLALVLLAIILSVLFLIGWDVFVSRTSARVVAASGQAPPLVIARTVYFSVQMTGAALCGVVIARLLFSRQRSFWPNATRYLGPILLVLIVTSMVTAFERGLIRSSAYLLLRNGLTIFAMVGAAFLISRLTRER